MKLKKCMSLSIVILIASTTDAGAQVTRSAINASGSETVAIAPEKIRLVMWIKAQAKDSDTATLALNEHKQRVREELEQLKADKSSIAFSVSRIGFLSDDPRSTRNYLQQQMIRAVGNQRGKPQALPAVCTAKCAVKADWILPTTDGEILAKLQVSLREQLVARDLAGEKNKANLTVAEQEVLDEIENNADRYFAASELIGNSAGTGPRIVFWARVPDGVMNAATAAAFKKATKQVQVLCDAAGVKQGELLSVNSPVNQMAESTLSRNVARQFPINFLADEAGAISSLSPDDLSATYTVNVTYSIQ